MFYIVKQYLYSEIKISDYSWRENVNKFLISSVTNHNIGSNLIPLIKVTIRLSISHISAIENFFKKTKVGKYVFKKLYSKSEISH